MDKETVVAVLHAHRDKLHELGVDSLALFGSVARNEAGDRSDIDLAAVYNDTTVRDLIDMGGIAAAIEAALGTDRFDLADEQRLLPHVRDSFLREHVRIF